MKKILGMFLALAMLAIAAPALAQNGPQNGLPASRIGSLYFAQQYATWRASTVSGVNASGAGTVIVYPAIVTLADGRQISPYSTATPVTVDSDTETPSAVSIGACPVGYPASQNCASLTATWGAAHYSGINNVSSGDVGIEEAITDAGASGGGLVFWSVDTGVVTVSTSGATTTTAAFVPTQYINFGASAIIETALNNVTNWAVGVASHTSAFCSVDTTLSAGQNCIATQVAPSITGTSTALTAILFTTTGTQNTTGAIKVRVWGYTPVQSTN